jgi:hypothetical protein
VEQVVSSERVVEIIREILDPFMHVKRAKSIAYATAGAMHASRWNIHEIGRGMARARGVSPKHAIKQVDRLLSNDGFDLEAAFKASVRFLVGVRKRIVVAMDWTDFDADDQTTIAINMLTNHGRATPLVWKTVKKSELAGARNDAEDQALYLLRDALPPGVSVVVVADRGFGSIEFFQHLKEYLGWDYVVRFRGDINVFDEVGRSKRAADLVQRGRPIVDLPSAFLTNRKFETRIVCAHAPEMKDAWYIATSLDVAKTAVVRIYGKRFTIEENFRDLKDHRFGFALSDTSIGTPERRDRMLFLLMLATALMTILGAASEKLGLDRLLRANTVKNKRTHSLLRQAHELIAGALEFAWERLRLAFESILAAHRRTRVVEAIL